MRRIRLMTTLLIFCMSIIAAHSQSKVNVLLDYHYQLGIAEKGYHKITRSDSKMYGNSLHLTVLYNINKQVSTGLGIGADRYEKPGYNTFPLYASLHFSPLKKFLNLYTYTNIGYAIFDKTDIYQGVMWDLGVGYKKMFKKHFGINVQLGYNLKQFKDVDYYIYDSKNEEFKNERRNNIRNSLSMGVGLIF